MKKFKYIAAPLEDISDSVFRTLCYKYGADLTFTEMARLEGLARKNASTWSRLCCHDNTPVVVQLLGSKEDRLNHFLGMFEPSPGFKGINLNMGCPNPKVIRIGQGCALVKRLNKARSLVRIIRDYGYPVSIKMRLGLNSFEKKKKIYLALIKSVNADFFVVHARHGLEGYDSPADYSVFPECVATGKQIIANGDIDSKEKVESLRTMGVAGVMIGRAAVKNPAIFNELKGLSAPNPKAIREEYILKSKELNHPYRYQKQVLKHLGNESEWQWG